MEDGCWYVSMFTYNHVCTYVHVHVLFFALISSICTYVHVRMCLKSLSVSCDCTRFKKKKEPSIEFWSFNKKRNGSIVSLSVP